MGPKQSAFVDTGLVSSSVRVGGFHVPLYRNLVLIRIMPTFPPQLSMQPSLQPSQQGGILLPGCVIRGVMKSLQKFKAQTFIWVLFQSGNTFKMPGCWVEPHLFVCSLILFWFCFLSPFNKFWTPTQFPYSSLFFELFRLKLGWGAWCFSWTQIW